MNRRFEVGRFGHNYNDAPYKMTCDVKCLDMPNVTQYEEKYGKEEFWKFRKELWIDMYGTDSVNENLEQHKEETISQILYDCYIGGHVANDEGAEYFDTLQPVDFVYGYENGWEYAWYNEAKEMLASDYHLDIDIKDFTFFELTISLTPKEWYFEGRQAGYYTIEFEVNGFIKFSYRDKNGYEIEGVDTYSLDDLFSETLTAEWWEQFVGLYQQSTGYTKDINIALQQYIDSLAGELEHCIYLSDKDWE